MDKRLCRKCGGKIPWHIIIDNKSRNLKNRRHCLQCVPFGCKPNKTHEDTPEYNRIKYKKWYYRRKREDGINPVTGTRHLHKSMMIELLGGGCQICDYAKCMHSLVFHHIRDKKIEIHSQAFSYSLVRLVAELRKCTMFCHNCHTETHHGLIGDARVAALNNDVNKALDLIQVKTWKDFRGSYLNGRGAG